MKKTSLMVAALLLGAISTSFANPVTTKITFSNIASLNSKNISASECETLFKNGQFSFNREKPVSFIASKKMKVVGSKTIFDKNIGNQRVLLKYGKAVLQVGNKKIVTPRLSLVISAHSNKTESSGAVVLENYCSADFVGQDLTS